MGYCLDSSLRIRSCKASMEIPRSLDSGFRRNDDYCNVIPDTSPEGLPKEIRDLADACIMPSGESPSQGLLRKQLRKWWL